jgi:hypothetical protein
MGGYIRWAGLVDDPTKAIEVTERLTGRQLDPFARDARQPSSPTRPPRRSSALQPSARRSSTSWCAAASRSTGAAATH